VVAGWVSIFCIFQRTPVTRWRHRAANSWSGPRTGPPNQSSPVRAAAASYSSAIPSLSPPMTPTSTHRTYDLHTRKGFVAHAYTNRSVRSLFSMRLAASTTRVVVIVAAGPRLPDGRHESYGSSVGWEAYTFARRLNRSFCLFRGQVRLFRAANTDTERTRPPEHSPTRVRIACAEMRNNVGHDPPSFPCSLNKTSMSPPPPGRTFWPDCPRVRTRARCCARVLLFLSSSALRSA
jgi:hypothetical protein